MPASSTLPGGISTRSWAIRAWSNTFGKTPSASTLFVTASATFLRNVKGEEARTIGRRALNLAINLKLDRGDLHY